MNSKDIKIKPRKQYKLSLSNLPWRSILRVAIWIGKVGFLVLLFLFIFRTIQIIFTMHNLLIVLKFAYPSALMLLVLALVAINLHEISKGSKRLSQKLSKKLKPKKFQLVIGQGGQELKRKKLDRPLYAIGKDPTCTINLEDESISSEQCRIYSTKDGWVAQNLSADAGTFVNNKQIEDSPQTLAPNDVISFSPNSANKGLWIRFQEQSMEPSSQASGKKLSESIKLSPLAERTSPAQIELRNLIIVLALVWIGFLIVFFAFNDKDIAPEMTYKGIIYYLTPYSIKLFPNFFLGAIFAGLFLLGSIIIRRKYPDADPYLLPMVALLTGLGLIVLYRLGPMIALDQNKPSLRSIAIKQFIWVGLGLIGMISMAWFLPARFFKEVGRKKYVYVLFSVLLIVFTGIFGQEINNRKLWINLGFFSVQTIEIVKVLLLFFIAGYFRDEGPYIKMTKFMGLPVPQLRFTGPFYVMWVLAILPVFFQKDFGPMVLLFGVFLAMYYAGTGSLAMVILGFVGLIVGGGFCYFMGWPSMVKTRVDMWLYPFTKAEGIVRSLWAIAAGGIFGVGLGFGLPHTLPVVQSDFNFSAICEELGFLGGASVIMLYALFVWRGFLIADRTRDSYQRLLAVGISTMFALQALMIIGGNMGLIPMTGITLPFMSAGGSAIFVNFLMLGLLIRISGEAGKTDDSPKPEDSAIKES